MITLLKLVLSHLLIRFFILPKKWSDEKEEKGFKSKYLYLQTAIIGIGALIALSDIKYWIIVVLIVISHLLIEACRIKFLSISLLSFLLVQFLHLVVFIYCVTYLMAEPIAINFSINTINLAIIVGFLFITYPAGIIVNLATKSWQEEINQTKEERDSLENAGKWIGIFERILILIFILINESQAIGFLIAAKSILRFSDRNQDRQRKETEYVLIGTLISVTIAICIGIAIKSL
ncbi:MAG: DUF3307 domain-containing protein [Saprospiraceae bacterium]|nr:DUF3307 domain-containing protein [Saprospiraceae bacterium]